MWRAYAIAVMVAWAGLSNAQEAVSPDTEAPEAVTTAILTVDIDRLFRESAFGQRIFREYAENSEVLAEEQRSLAADLREEELSLADRRPGMDPAAFRIEAEAFDEKTQAIRRAQDAKVEELEQTLSDGRDRFIEVSRPILGQLMEERGAGAIFDRRAVLLSRGSIDVTDIAIARIDDAIGDGAAD